jgi:hypothetical protein
MLDGVWAVRRTGGALPPLLGMRKEIDGGRGVTILGPLHARFEVRGNAFHYGAPFTGLVDIVEPTADDSVCRGRATFRGREFGQFELRKIATSQRPRSGRL